MTGDVTWPLLEGERVLWTGRPGGGLVLTPRDAILVPFSLVWGGFALFWEATVLRTNAPFFFRLWGIPFVLIGFYLILGRFMADAWLRARTRYALTNLRIFIVRTGPMNTITALALDRLPEVQVSQRADGRGTLRFGSPARVSLTGTGFGWGSWTPSLDPTPQFLAIDNAQDVFQQVQRAARGAVDAPSKRG